MRNRASWVLLVAAVTLAIGGLSTTVTSSYPGGTDLAATPCSITAAPVTIVKDPVIRFEAKVSYGDGRESIAKAPATNVVFYALPSGTRVGSKALAPGFRIDLKVPNGTTNIGVKLMTGDKTDVTRPPTKDNTGLYPIDKKRATTVTWLIPYASKAQAERKTQY